MKTKHKFVIGLAAFVLAGVLSLGCKTAPINTANGFIQSDTNGVLYLGGHPIPPDAAGVTINVATKYGTMALVQQQPDSRQYLAISAGVIDVAIQNQNYDPVALQNALQSATGNATAASAISDGLQLYSAFYGQVAASGITNASPYLGPCLQGLADGITAGLELSPIVTNAPAASPPPLTTPFKLPSGLVKPLVK